MCNQKDRQQGCLSVSERYQGACQQVEQQQQQHVQMGLDDNIFNDRVCGRVAEDLAQNLRDEGVPSS